MKSNIIKVVVILFVLIPVIFIGSSVYNDFYGIDKDSPSGEYSFDVSSGEGVLEVSQKLEKDNVIRNSSYFEILSKTNEIKPLQVGQYNLDLPAKPTEIISQIDSETRRIEKEIADIGNKPTINITFNEGWSLDRMIDKLDSEGVATKEELQTFAQDPSKFSIESFEFLPEPLNCNYGDLSNCAKYYPEGYLYPDTYSFFVPSTPAEIYTKMLANFNTKVWSQYQNQGSKEDFHKQIILASVIERESGRTRGITEESAPEVSLERKQIASSLLNRLENNIPWQSNVTVNYGTDFNLCEQTIEFDSCKFLDDPEFQTLYNTYQITDYPIGPVTSPSIDNIDAAMNPADTSYIFFVADNTGKTYFAETDSGHLQNIEKVKQINSEL